MAQGRKSRPKVEIRGVVLGEGQQAPSPSGEGIALPTRGWAESPIRISYRVSGDRCELSQRGSEPRPPKGFPLFSALRMASQS